MLDSGPGLDLIEILVETFHPSLLLGWFQMLLSSPSSRRFSFLFDQSLTGAVAGKVGLQNHIVLPLMKTTQQHRRPEPHVPQLLSNSDRKERKSGATTTTRDAFGIGGATTTDGTFPRGSRSNLQPWSWITKQKKLRNAQGTKLAHYFSTILIYVLPHRKQQLFEIFILHLRRNQSAIRQNDKR